MHITGKILTWTAVLAACAAVVLTSKMITVRNSWTKEIEGVQSQNEQKAVEIAENARTLDEVRGELDRTKLGWGQHWDGVAVNVLASGDLEVRNFGTDNGLGVPQPPDPPVVYAFQPAAEGGSRYVGAFQATTLQRAKTGLKATWRVRDGERETWKPGNNWRLREQIPPRYLTLYSDLRSQLTVADELLAAKRHNLTLQQKLLAAAGKHLNFRLQELLGVDPLPANVPTGRGREFVVGLVQAIEEEEEARNTVHADVDRLRRELKEAVQRLQKLVGENTDLAKSLPQPKSNATADARK